MKQLQTKILNSLIAIGRAVLCGKSCDHSDIEEVRPHDAINCQGPNFWEQVAAYLSDDELAELTCGLAYVESDLRWAGGSVSGVIWLFRALVARKVSIELLDQVSGWVLTNSKNPYSPFGTQISLGAKNYSEYCKRSEARSVEIAKLVAADQNLEARAEAERISRGKMAAAGAKDRGTKIRREIIQSMEGLTLAEKITRVASDPVYPPQFFPTSIADSATQADIDALPEPTRLELARRLKGRRKGPWQHFRRRLLVSLGPVWNKKPWRV